MRPAGLTGESENGWTPADALLAAEMPAVSSEFVSSEVLATGESGNVDAFLRGAPTSVESTAATFVVFLERPAETVEQHKTTIADNNKTHLRICRQGRGSELAATDSSVAFVQAAVTEPLVTFWEVLLVRTYWVFAVAIQV